MTKMTDRLEDKATTESLIAFFKAIPDDWYERTSGNVEAPCGWFGLVVITDEFITAWDEEELAGMAVPKEVAKGSYLVIIYDNGLVWAYTGTDEAIDAELASREAEYAAWCGEADGGSTEDGADNQRDVVPVALESNEAFEARLMAYIDNLDFKSARELLRQRESAITGEE